MSASTPAAGRAGTVLSRTRQAVGLLARRRDTLAVFVGVTAAYLLVYLWAIGHLAPGVRGTGVTLAADPLEQLLRSRGPFNFAPVARVQLGPVTYLASLNTLLGLALSGLVGLNLALTYLGWRQPATCGVGSSSAGLLAGLPAVLSGSACCGPVVLVVLGVQASGALLAGFQLLLPLAVLALLGSLVLVGRQVEPATLQ